MDALADFRCHRYRTYPGNDDGVTIIFLIWFHCHYQILLSNLSSIGREAFKSCASLAKRVFPISLKGVGWFFFLCAGGLPERFDTRVRIAIISSGRSITAIFFQRSKDMYVSRFPFVYIRENICRIFIPRISTISVVIITETILYQTWNRNGNFSCKICIEYCTNHTRVTIVYPYRF